MGSLWPWGKCRVAVVTVSLALVSTGVIGSTNSGMSYAGESALPPGVAAGDIEYNGRITVGGEPVTAAINTAKKKGVISV